MLGDRLREERERRGLTQPGLAAIAGAAKRTVIDWEKGVSSPTAVQMEAMSGEGFDIQYIVTGQRSAQVLAPDESLLLDRYRSSPRELRDAALRVLLGAPKAGAKQVVHGSVGQSATGDVINQKGVKIEVGETNAPGGRRRR